MQKSLKIIIIFCLLIAIFSQPALAVSPTYLTQAKKYYEKVCKSRFITGPIALDCYVFEKVGELETAISTLAARITNVETTSSSLGESIEDLEEQNAVQATKISSLENKVNDLTENQTPNPADFVFFNGPVSPAGAESQIFDAQKYSKVTFTYQGTASAFIVQVSGDQENWFTQFSRGEGENKSGGSVTLDSAGRYYRVLAGSTTLPPAEVYQNALGHFFN